VTNLTKSDVVVFCDGSSNVSKNNSNITLKHIPNLIKDHNNTNITLLSVTCRHDLMDFSRVSNENRTFNRKLMKYIKIVECSVLEINPNRECFTHHRLHLSG
jgi:hypothetical protein